MEFINLGLITLFASLDRENITEMLMGNLIAEKQNYEDFTADWYMDVGNALCIQVFMSSFLNNAAGILMYTFIGCRRIWDRGCRSELKNDPEDPEDDLPNTKQKI